MRITLILISFLINSLLFAQTVILPLDTPYDNIPENGYLKDMQNQLNPFVGTWIYTQGSNKITIKLEKVIDYIDIGTPKYYKDKIKGLYKVQNGQTVIYNDLNEVMLKGDINGVNFWQGYYQMSYWDDNECLLLYHVKIKLDPDNSNKLIWEMRGDHITPLDEDCARISAPDFGGVSTLPMNMVLTKQSMSGGL